MNAVPRANANKLIEKYNLKKPNQYSLEEILNAEGLILERAPLTGCLGMIQYGNKFGIVTISSAISNYEQENFTIAHELGHYCNEKKVFRICNAEDIYGIRSIYEYEVDANTFASEFLMHKPWFELFVKGKKLTKEMLIEAASYFNVSLSAVAIRYAEIGYHPCAVIMSQNKIVKWKAINQQFKFQFVRIGTKVSDLSYASDWYEGKVIPNQEDVPARAWFNEDFNLKNKNERIMEMNIPMPNYNSVLTVLWEQ